MILSVKKRRERYSPERLGWQQERFISQQGVEGILEEGEGEEIMVVEVLVGGVKKRQRIVSGAVSRTIGVESARRRIASVHGAGE